MNIKLIFVFVMIILFGIGCHMMDQYRLAHPEPCPTYYWDVIH